MIGEGVGVEPYTLEYLKRLLWDEEEEGREKINRQASLRFALGAKPCAPTQF
jgi:hypothetical protein